MGTPKAPKLDKRTYYFIQAMGKMQHISSDDLFVLVAGIDHEAKQVGIGTIVTKGVLTLLDLVPEKAADYFGPVTIWRYAPGEVVGFEIRRVGRVEPFWDSETKRVGCTYERVVFIAVKADDALILEFANQIGKLGLDK